jgi:hypothetical protein
MHRATTSGVIPTEARERRRATHSKILVATADGEDSHVTIASDPELRDRAEQR